MPILSTNSCAKFAFVANAFEEDTVDTSASVAVGNGVVAVLVAGGCVISVVSPKRNLTILSLAPPDTRAHTMSECLTCHQKFATKGSLQRHKRTQHAGVKPRLICQQCGIDYARIDSLSLHMKEKHQMKLEDEEREYQKRVMKDPRLSDPNPEVRRHYEQVTRVVIGAQFAERAKRRAEADERKEIAESQLREPVPKKAKRRANSQRIECEDL